MITHPETNTSFVGRELELRQLEEFSESPGSGFTFLRGRRRVGKTWVLKALEKKYDHHEGTPNVFCFYYMGSRKLDDSKEQESFSREWALKTGEQSLLEISKSFRSWKRIFTAVTSFAQRKPELKILLLLDEIQWLVKSSDMVSRIKEAWIDWEQAGNVKIVVCGSSSRFFKKKALAAEAVLRGLRTRSSIWIKEFSPREIKSYYLKDWLDSELILTYMMLGGVPYYYSTLDTKKGFIQAINDLFFLNTSIFQEEVDEMLNLEFNSQGAQTAKQVLSHIGQQGATLSTLIKKSGLAKSTVSNIVSELVEFDLLFPLYPMGKPTPSNNQGVRYVLRDFFLNFYFQVLQKYESLIKANTKGLIFPAQILSGDHNYYIPNFSGHAFELYVENSLRNFISGTLHQELSLRDANYVLGHYWDKNQEIDLIVEGKTDRIARIIECKWQTSSLDLRKVCTDLTRKSYNIPKGFRSKYFLFTPLKVSEKQRDIAAKNGVVLIGKEGLV